MNSRVDETIAAMKFSCSYEHDQRFAKEPLHLGFTTDTLLTDDADLVSRIISAYRHSMALFDGHGDSMWKKISDWSTDTQSVLRWGAFKDARELLRNPATHNLLYGFDETNATHRQAHELCDEDTHQAWARRILYRLVKLAEAVGAIRIFNPENQNVPDVTIDTLLSALDDRFGFYLDFPNPYPDEYGLKTSRGIVDHRTLIAVYNAWRLTTLASPSDRILEIGAGTGRTAYYARRFNLCDYTIVDLPHTNVAQANFLGRTITPSAIILADEPNNSDRTKIRIYNPNWFFNSVDKFDVVLNGDSITEIDQDKATAYFREIILRAKVFISINHEANKFRVADLPVLTKSKVACCRFPFWLRDGYTEEIFFMGNR